jgi:hypothetical protein
MYKVAQVSLWLLIFVDVPACSGVRTKGCLLVGRWGLCDGVNVRAGLLLSVSCVQAQLAPKGPAATSGAVKVGDYIMEVNSTKLAGMHSKDVKALIRGPSGSSVTIRASRPGAGGGPYEVSLTRSGGEADQSLASMSETASSVGGGSTVGGAGMVVGREPTIAERMKEGCDAAIRVYEELDRLRAGGGASASAATKYAKEAAELTKELDFARSQLAQSQFRADALQQKVDDSLAALEESAKLLEQREHSDADKLSRIVADNEALQRALREVGEKGAAQTPGHERELQLLREKTRRLEEELAAMRTRQHLGVPESASKTAPAKPAATGFATPLRPLALAVVTGDNAGQDDDVRSVRSAASSTFSTTPSAVSAGTPELCGVGMRLTNTAPHRVILLLSALLSFEPAATFAHTSSDPYII